VRRNQSRLHCSQVTRRSSSVVAVSLACANTPPPPPTTTPTTHNSNNFYDNDNKRRTTNDERRTTNDERRTTNDERRTTTNNNNNNNDNNKQPFRWQCEVRWCDGVTASTCSEYGPKSNLTNHKTNFVCKSVKSRVPVFLCSPFPFQFPDCACRVELSLSHPGPEYPPTHLIEM